MDAIRIVEAGQLKKDRHGFDPGDQVRVHVKVIEGVFTSEQKRAIVEKLTDAMVAVEGERLRPVTVVVLDEVKGGNWGIGGKPLTTQDVHDLQAAGAR